MAEIVDILNIEPSVISRDLKGKYLAIYGKEKVGKSTFGARLPRSLFCNFEVGTNFIAGVKAQKIDKWSTFKLVLRQLEKPQAREMYDTIVIDTAGQAYTLCEEFVCQQNGVQKLGDVPYGAAYATCKKEYEAAFRKIQMLGYGICFICHVETKKEPGPNDTTIEKYAPALPSRAADVVNRLVDIIAYIDMQFDENGDAVRRFITRRTPSVVAGSRLPYLAPIIPFSYDNLVNAIGEAIEKQVKLDGATVVDSIESTSSIVFNYNEQKAEALELWKALVGNGETYNPEMEARVLKRVEMIFGRPMRLSEITEDQTDLYNLVLIEMRELLQEKK